VADQLAEAGYLAIAPDFLSETGPGGGGTDSFGGDDAARSGIGQLPAEQVTADLDAVFKHAKEMPAANGTVAVCGFCWGGGKTFAYAAHNPQIAAAFVFYGTAPGPDQIEKIKVPVYGFYGGNDFRITGQVPATQEAMQGEGQKYEPVTYEGAGHGFMRQGESPEAKPEDKSARDAAWERWKEVLAGL
jgi:carboxymethylenebutenolidase